MSTVGVRGGTATTRALISHSAGGMQQPNRQNYNRRPVHRGRQFRSRNQYDVNNDNNNHHQQPPPPPPPPHRDHHASQPIPPHRNVEKLGKDIEEIKVLFLQLSVELNMVKTRVQELETSAQKARPTAAHNDVAPGNDEHPKTAHRKKVRPLRKNAKQAEKIEQTGEQPESNGQKESRSTAQSADSDDPKIRKKIKSLKFREKRFARRRRDAKTYPELSDSELSEVVQTLKREFINGEKTAQAIKKTMNVKGPRVVYEFCASILDHAICDVTSPTKLSEIANNLYQLLVSEDNISEVDFQQGFYEALSDIAKREYDIVIDAPRYMDTLGQLLADCVIPMYIKYKNLVRKFLNKCIDAYCADSRSTLLAAIMKSVASTKSDRFAKEIWDQAHLNWNDVLKEGVDLKEFLATNEVEFTTKTFSPEPRDAKKVSQELEKLADDITSLVEKRCSCKTLEDLIKEPSVENLGTLIYALVRGCLSTESGVYKLNNEALNKYSSILTAKNENQDAIALHALTALTKLWHQYNCPQDLLRTILMELHNQGTASYSALDSWLNSESLTNIPGIGAARLSSKRYIENLGANLKAEPVNQK